RRRGADPGLGPLRHGPDHHPRNVRGRLGGRPGDVAARAGGEGGAARAGAPRIAAPGGGLPAAAAVRAHAGRSATVLAGPRRLEAGYRRPLPFGLTGNFRYQYSRGRGLWGYRDINLDESRVTTLADGRLFYGDPATISTRSGAVSMVSSRIDPAFANVYEVS